MQHPGTARIAYKSRDRRRPFRVTVTAEENADVRRRALDAGLSIASYLRSSALGKRMRPVLDHAAVNELVRVAGEQQRLAGILNSLLEQPALYAPETDVKRLLGRLDEMQVALADAVARL